MHLCQHSSAGLPWVRPHWDQEASGEWELAFACRQATAHKEPSMQCEVQSSPEGLSAASRGASHGHQDWSLEEDISKLRFEGDKKEAVR